MIMNSYTTELKDVVCGMEVNANDISLDYQGSHYVFCSNQCLERFKLNPHLYIGYPGSEAPKHAGIEVLKKRKLKLAEPLPQEVADQFIEYIEVMMGIHSIKINGNQIEITYDLLQVTESQIEKTITDVGVTLGNDMMEKIRRAFVHSMEEIEVESLEARPGSGHGHHH
jgi:YHS domain-containing protein